MLRTVAMYILLSIPLAGIYWNRNESTAAGWINVLSSKINSSTGTTVAQTNQSFRTQVEWSMESGAYQQLSEVAHRPEQRKSRLGSSLLSYLHQGTAQVKKQNDSSMKPKMLTLLAVGGDQQNDIIALP